MHHKITFLFPVIASVCVEYNTLSAATFTYSYDSLNRLTNVIYSDGSSESYSYDQAGNRTRQAMQTATIKLDNTPPATPTNLTVVSSIPSQLTVSWNRAFDAGGSGLAGYEVFANGTLVSTTSSTNFSLSGLSLNTQYCLAIAALDRAGNLSPQSSSLCLTTPIFQPPYLVLAGVVSGNLQIGVTGGTSGPYDLWGSSNLLNWQRTATIWLPLNGSFFYAPSTNNISAYFYRLGWSTNSY